LQRRRGGAAVSAAIGCTMTLLVIVQTVRLERAMQRLREREGAMCSMVSGIIDCCREVRRGE
jgi:hypothetical protein